METTDEIVVRLLGDADIPAALRLKELARWNQTEDDWRRLIQLEPRGCFCATAAGRVIATTTTIRYGCELAWIGMVLVDPDYRRRGIATQLMQEALDYLGQVGVAAVKLDATPEGRPVYEKLGFAVESLIERWEGVAGSFVSTCATLDAATLREALDIDGRAFGADRSSLIELLIDEACTAPLVVREPGGPVKGYALARSGTAAAYVGPLVASAADVAIDLLDGMLSQLSGQRVYIDLNTDFGTGRDILAARGFVKQRDLIRMSHGEKSAAGCSASVFAIAGPEFG